MSQKTVLNFTDFKAAVQDDVTDEILLGGDITYSGGVKIPVTKKTLLINGNGHTITDNLSSAYTDTLYVPSGAGEMTVTLKNAKFSGRNYYGVICVYDDTANSNVTTVLDGVTYNGPQAVYNRYGVTVIKDCNITIEKNGNSAAPQEFAECNRIQFGGKTTINSQSSSNAVIWFPYANSAFTVENNASLTVSAPNTYMFYTDSAAKPALKFGNGSSAVFSVKSGMFYAAGTGAHIASAITVGENASVKITSATAGGVPILKCSGAFTLNPNAEFWVISPASGSSPLMYFSAAAKIAFEKPKSLLLYSNGGKVFSFAAGSASSPNRISISAEQINFWQTAKTPFSAAGGFDDLPQTAAHKPDWALVTITQELSGSAVLSTESNLVSGDSGYPLGTENFDLTKAKVLSAGKLDLSIDEVTDISESVTGQTESAAAVKYAYDGAGKSGFADESGSYSLPVSKKFAVGSEITVQANKNFLIKGIKAAVSGSVSITSLADIPFNAIAAPYNASFIKRQNAGWFLELTDTRPQGGAYSLYLSVEKGLHSDTQSVENAVIFIDGEKNVLTQNALLIKQGATTAAGIIRVSWEEAAGVLLQVDPSENYSKGNYSAVLKWFVEF